MDETDGDSRYPSNYRVNQGLNSNHQPNVTIRNVQQFAGNYVDLDADDEEEDEEEQEQEVDANGTTQQNKDNVDDDDTDDDNDSEDDRQNENFNLHRHPKKRKLKSLLSSFELVPRVPTPAPLQISPPTYKPSFGFGGRNALTDWTEIETFALLDAWGERFVKRGRKSLRSEEWQQVAEKVAPVSRIARTDTQCRNRLDTLKKKYKKEKALLQHNKNATSKWVYFKKMDMLIAPTQEPQPGPLPQSHPEPLRRPQPRVIYLNSPGNTDSTEGDDDDDDEDSDAPPPKKTKIKENTANVGPFKLLADSINRFSDVYEKIETRKRKEMLELEKMRMDLYRELELQKNQILEQARAEIVKIGRGDYQDNDSAGNVSG